MIAGIYLVERPEDILSIDDMLDRANLAQKSVNISAASKYALYSEEMRKRVLTKDIESCMEEALRNREFCLHLQPQVDIQHGDALFGAEVLVRWERPGYGMVSPRRLHPVVRAQRVHRGSGCFCVRRGVRLSGVPGFTRSCLR